MNKERRKALTVLQNRIYAVLNGLDFIELIEKVEAIKSDLESLRDEEQEYYDNMPTSLQDGEKGQDASFSVDCMETGLGQLEEFIEALTELTSDGKLEEAVSSIDEAKGAE